MSNVLVVDDSPTDRVLAGGLLQKTGEWSVEYASNGQEALDLLDRFEPDLVVTDLQMPEMDGLELVSRISSEYEKVPVVLITAHGSEEIAVEALKQGAASYVPKTNLSKDLSSTVQRVLQASARRQYQEQLFRHMAHCESQFELPPNRAIISAFVSHIQEFLTSRESLIIAVALDEALTNAHIHGNLELASTLREQDDSEYDRLSREREMLTPYKNRKIFVDTRINSGEVRFVVRDEGSGFNPETLPDPTDPANITRPHGRGVLLMRTFMDEVIFNTTGNEVTLVKQREQEGE